MNVSRVTPREAARVDAKREDRRAQQPYASELDDRELEHAHKDHRPVNPKGASISAESTRKPQ